MINKHVVQQQINHSDNCSKVNTELDAVIVGLIQLPLFIRYCIKCRYLVSLIGFLDEAMLNNLERLIPSISILPQISRVRKS